MRGVEAWSELVKTVERAFVEAEWPEAGRDVVVQFEPGELRTLRVRIRFTRRLVSLKRQSASDGRRTVSKKIRDEMAGLRLEIESAAVAEREWLLSKF